MDISDEDRTDDQIEMVDLDGEKRSIEKKSQRISLSQSRFSPQRRKRQILLTASIVSGLFCLFLWNILPVRQMLFPSQKNVVTSLSSNQRLFYFQSLPSWGTFFLDNRKLDHIPLTLADRGLSLPTGKHDLEWRAAPFQSLHCQLTLPVTQMTATNGCHLQDVQQPNAGKAPTSLITFPGTFSLQNLPAPSRQSLLQETQHLLDTLEGTTTLLPGEHVLQSDHRVQIVTKTEQVKQRFVLDSETRTQAECEGVQFEQSCFIDGQDCRLFCTLDWPSDGEKPTQEGWHVAAIFHPVWTYSPQIQGQQEEVQGGVQFVTLSLKWANERWQVAFHQQGESSFDDPNCITMIGTIAADPVYRSLPMDWAYLSGENRAAGCLAVPIAEGASFSDNSIFDNAHLLLLQRSGILLAASQEAHQRWPSLPYATEHETSLAKEIIQQRAFIS